MSLRKLILPDLGFESQPIVLSMWLAKRGSNVNTGDPLVEVLCGCVTVDLPSPADGILVKKLAEVDETLVAGQEIAVIE